MTPRPKSPCSHHPVTAPRESPRTFSAYLQYQENPFLILLQWLPREDQGNRMVLSKAKPSVVLCGSDTFLSMYLSLRGESPYWWQDLRVGMVCDNFPFRNSLKAKCAKAIEMRKGDYSQEGWPTLQIGISKWCCPVECWERQDVTRLVLYGSQMRVRWSHNSSFFPLASQLSFFFGIIT